MKITMLALRKMIREEMERNLRWTAGIAMNGARLSQPGRGITYGVPPGLGKDSGDEIEEKENEELGYEEESS